MTCRARRGRQFASHTSAAATFFYGHLDISKTTLFPQQLIPPFIPLNPFYLFIFRLINIRN